MLGMSSDSGGDTQRLTNLEVEDHGTNVMGLTRLVCGVAGCNRTAKFTMRGYIHFTFDGTTYSCDSLKLCEAHKTVLNQRLDTDTESEGDK